MHFSGIFNHFWGILWLFPDSTISPLSSLCSRGFFGGFPRNPPVFWAAPAGDGAKLFLELLTTFLGIPEAFLRLFGGILELFSGCFPPFHLRRFSPELSPLSGVFWGGSTP